MNKIYAFSGTHGVGKTSWTTKEFYNYKLEFPEENIGLLINLDRSCPLPINQTGTVDTQRYLFTDRIRNEIISCVKYDVVFTDQTIFDIMAYSLSLGYKDLYDSMIKMAIYHRPFYEEISVLLIENNDYHYDDGLRDMDKNFRQKVQDNLLMIYDNLGVKYETL